MRKFTTILASAAMLGMAGYAAAQDRQDKLPPENGKKVSEIAAQIESRPDFRYLESIEWEDEGYYEITYHTPDRAKVEIKIDAVTGEPRGR